MNLYAPVEKCKTCDPSCNIWFVGSRNGMPRQEVRIKRIVPENVKDGFIVMTDTTPMEGVVALEVREDSIQDIAMDVCPVWRGRIHRMYTAGYRWIYFTETKPEGIEEYEQQMFDVPEVEEQGLRESVI